MDFLTLVEITFWTILWFNVGYYFRGHWDKRKQFIELDSEIKIIKEKFNWTQKEIQTLKPETIKGVYKLLK